MDLRLEVMVVPVSDVARAGHPARVRDVETARAELAGRGVDVSDARFMGPEDMDGAKFGFFADPDGNAWAVQQYRGG